MKVVLSLVVIYLFFANVGFGQAKWGPWNKSPKYPGIECRVAYSHYDSVAAKKKQPPHVWCLQIHNSGAKKVGISWNVSDKGAIVTDTDSTYRRNPCINKDEIIEDCKWYTRTAPNQSVSVWFLNMEDCKDKK